MSQHSHLYQNRAWRKRRALLLAAEPLCRLCAARGRTTAATVADHVTPHRGDRHAFDYGDLQPLCATCHSGAKQAEDAGSGLRGGDTSGYPVDTAHHWNRAT